jgi:Na+-driven multidrug efflux pump
MIFICPVLIFSVLLTTLAAAKGDTGTTLYGLSTSLLLAFALAYPDAGREWF